LWVPPLSDVTNQTAILQRSNATYMTLGQAADPKDPSLVCPQITLGGPSTGPVQDSAHTNDAEQRCAHGPMWEHVNPHDVANVPQTQEQAGTSAASLLAFGFHAGQGLEPGTSASSLLAFGLNAGEPLEARASAETQPGFDLNGRRGVEPGTSVESQPAFTFDFTDGEPVNSAIHGQGQNVQMSPGLWAGTSPARCGILRPLDVVPQSPMVCASPTAAMSL
jgi:hypothetical protein